MALGIDFGTTRTVVATAQHGNFPVVLFLDGQDDLHEYYPSLIAQRDNKLVYGWDAQEASNAGYPTLRSIKRILSSGNIIASTKITIGTHETTILDLMTGFFSALRAALENRSNLNTNFDTAASIAIPAHARSGQRFLTIEAARKAGFKIQAMLNEPSAAAFEYTHNRQQTISSRRTKVLIYDLGGGTFDASAVRVADKHHEVLDTVGINKLGGDDFDQLLATLALKKIGTNFDDLTDLEQNMILDEARNTKECINPQTKKLFLEINSSPVQVTTKEFYDEATKLVNQTITAIKPLTSWLDSSDVKDIAGIYLVGGASQLPIVARNLREIFGRRVYRAPMPSSSTAVGLAISLDPDAHYSVEDRLSRGFGVFREMKAGAEVSFDPIFGRDTETNQPQHVTRRYRAAHTIGIFRFVEYSYLGQNSEPQGDLVPFGEVKFPFVGDLTDKELDSWPVEPLTSGPLIEERYKIDEHGVVHIEIVNLDAGFKRNYSLGQQ